MKLRKVIEFLQHAESIGQTELILIDGAGNYREIELGLSKNLAIYGTKIVKTKVEVRAAIAKELA